MSACKTCAYRNQSLAYPLLYCSLRGLMVNQSFVCTKFKDGA
jgi:hypothetical protein